MSDLHTADIIDDADLADDVEFAVRLNATAGLLRGTFAKLATYLTTALANRLIPAGGASGKVLGKVSATDYDVGWITGGGGGGSGGSLVKLDTITLAADGDPIDFSAIDPLYTDLILVVYPVLVGGVGNKQVSLEFNGDSGANYDYRRFSPLEGEAANNSALGLIGQTGYSTTGNMPIECTIYDYTNSAHVEKFARASSSDEGGGNFYMSWANMKWHPATAAAITDIVVNINNGVFKAGTRAVLYGRS